MKDKGKTDKSIIELIASISTSLLSLGRHFLKKKWQPSWKPASHCPIIHTKRYKQGPFPNEKFRGRKKTEPPPSCPLLFFFFTFFTTTRKISLLQRERERERERFSAVPPSPSGVLHYITSQLCWTTRRSRSSSSFRWTWSGLSGWSCSQLWDKERERPVAPVRFQLVPQRKAVVSVNGENEGILLRQSLPDERKTWQCAYKTLAQQTDIRLGKVTRGLDCIGSIQLQHPAVQTKKKPRCLSLSFLFWKTWAANSSRKISSSSPSSNLFCCSQEEERGEN